MHIKYQCDVEVSAQVEDLIEELEKKGSPEWMNFEESDLMFLRLGESEFQSRGTQLINVQTQLGFTHVTRNHVEYYWLPQTGGGFDSF